MYIYIYIAIYVYIYIYIYREREREKEISLFAPDDILVRPLGHAVGDPVLAAPLWYTQMINQNDNEI